jgi:1,4-alpha-glucan branching enzyme
MTSLTEFKLFAPYNKEAAVIGSFSDWQPVAMEKGKDGYFRTKIELEDGEYEYKFRVRSKSWFVEPDEWVEIVDPYAVNIAPESQNGTITIKDGEPILEIYWRYS